MYEWVDYSKKYVILIMWLLVPIERNKEKYICHLNIFSQINLGV